MLRVITIVIFITYVTSCTFPSDLIGEWQSLSYGTLTFTSTTFSGFTSMLHSSALTFSCFLSSGTQYVVNTTYDIFVGQTAEVYLCMNLKKISTIKYFYRLDGNLDATSQIRSYIPAAGTSVTADVACSYTDTRSPGEYDLLLLKSNLTDAIVSCPGALTTIFDIKAMSTVTSCDNETSVATLDGQTDTLLSYNYSSCVSAIPLNTNGQLYCLHSFSEDYGYVTTYNNQSVDNLNTFTFTCYVYSKSAEVLVATEYPTACHQSQTPTSVNSPGINYTMTDTLYVAPEDNTVVIVMAVVFGILGAVITVVGFLVLYFKVWRMRPETPPPPKVRKKKKKLAVTEYSPRITTRSKSLEEKDGLKTHSEIVTQLLTDRSAAIRYDYLDETKKEKWQDKWEKDLRPETPSTSTRTTFSKANIQNLSGLNLMSFSSNNIDHNLHLPMPSPLSARRQMKHRSDSSLPSTMHSTQSDTSRFGVKSPLRAETFNISPKVLEKLRISPRLFQNTGKYQFDTTVSNQDLATSRTADSKLEAIKEDPLSRPSSVSKDDLHVSKAFRRSAEELNKLQLSLRAQRGSSGVSVDRTTVTSRSTASARGVYIDDWGTLSNISETKGSQLNVFDDQGWLSKNDVNEAEDVFKRGTSFWSSLPKGKDRDQKWFTGGTKKADKKKTGDLSSHLNTRSKIITTGLNSMNKDGYSRPKKKRVPSKPNIIRPVPPVK